MNEYFENHTSEAITHPRLRRWRDLLQRSGSGTVELHREADEFGSGAATLYVNIGDVQDREPWSMELHRGLVTLGVRGHTHADEASRYALVLAAVFEPTERDVGEGFFNSVLVRQLADSDFEPRLHATLAQIHTYAPSSTSSSRARCDEQIREAIRGVAHELMALLTYEHVEAERILGDALEQYLDERFSLTARRAWGLQ